MKKLVNKTYKDQSGKELGEELGIAFLELEVGPNLNRLSGLGPMNILMIIVQFKAMQSYKATLVT